MKYTEEQREEAKKYLRKVLKPGDTVKTILRHCSRSGMSRSISLITKTTEKIDFYAARAMNDTIDRNNGGIKVGGCGMDMGFALVYNLGRTLWPNGNGKHVTHRNGDTAPETDGGSSHYLDFSQCKKFMNLLCLLQRVIFFPYQAELVKRLLELYQEAIDEETEGVGIPEESFYNFIRFISSSGIRELPDISLTSDNNIYASWRKESGHVFSAHFLPSGDAQFAVFIPGIQNPNKKTRISGVTSTETLFKTVESNIKEWLLV